MEGLSKNQGLQPIHAQQQQSRQVSWVFWSMADEWHETNVSSLRSFVTRIRLSRIGFSLILHRYRMNHKICWSLRSKNMDENLWGIFKVVLEWSDQKYVLALKYLPMVHDMYKFYESYGTFINAWAGLICRALTARTSRIFGSVLQSLPGYRDTSRCTLLTTHK